MPIADIEVVTVPSFIGLHLTVAPLDEAPVRPGVFFGPCLLGPGNDSDWVTGHWNGESWFGDDGLSVRPAWWMLLPLTQRGAQQLAQQRAADVKTLIGECEYDRAAKLIDVLADEVRALRDKPRRRLTD